MCGKTGPWQITRVFPLGEANRKARPPAGFCIFTLPSPLRESFGLPASPALRDQLRKDTTILYTRPCYRTLELLDTWGALDGPAALRFSSDARR
jgi:hypothetical protein